MHKNSNTHKFYWGDFFTDDFDIRGEFFSCYSPINDLAWIFENHGYTLTEDKKNEIVVGLEDFKKIEKLVEEIPLLCEECTTDSNGDEIIPALVIKVFHNYPHKGRDKYLVISPM